MLKSRKIRPSGRPWWAHPTGKWTRRYSAHETSGYVGWRRRSWHGNSTDPKWISVSLAEWMVMIGEALDPLSGSLGIMAIEMIEGEGFSPAAAWNICCIHFLPRRTAVPQWKSITSESMDRNRARLDPCKFLGSLSDCNEWQTRNCGPRKTLASVRRFSRSMSGSGCRSARQCLSTSSSLSS